MLQGDGLNGERAVVVDYLLPGGIHGMELYFIIETMAEQAHLELQHFFQFLRRIDLKTGRAPQEPERAQHANEPEAVVAMQMGDEDGTDLGEAQMGAPKLHLGAFAAVDKE